MAIQANMNRQRDFSGGELVEDAKRRDDEAALVGARTLRNWRLLNAGGFERRPGRIAQMALSARVDELIPIPEIRFKIAFGSGTLQIYSEDGSTLIINQSGFPWTLGTVDQITWAFHNRRLVVCYPDFRPVYAEFNGVTWSWVGNFTFDRRLTGELAQPFWRYEPVGETMYYDFITGNGNVGSEVYLNTSADVFQPGHVGFYFRYANRQVDVLEYINPRRVRGRIVQKLPKIADFILQKQVGLPTEGVIAGELVKGFESGAEGVVLAVISNSRIRVLITKEGFITRESGGERFIFPNWMATGVDTIGSGSGVPTNGPATATTFWDEALVSDARGWPQSVTSDQNRLIFCDLPGSTSDVVMWSAIGSSSDFAIGTEANEGMAEIVPGKRRVLHVAGSLGDEFVFTTKGIWVIPISVQNPLKPGNVDFRLVSAGGAARVRPVVTSEAVVYVAAGHTHIEAIIGTGQNTRPYVARNVSEFHHHLFKGKFPKAIAVAPGDGTFVEEYVFVCNTDGSIAVGKTASGNKEWVGWVPWDGAGAAFWISSFGEKLILTSNYSGRYLVEQIDTNEILDGMIYINDVPAQFATSAPVFGEPPVQEGPLWPWNGTVLLYDGNVFLGEREIVNGAIVPIGGESLTAETLKIGYSFTSIFEPFVPHAQGGQSARQTLRRRKIKAAALTVQNSTGFTFGRKTIAMFNQGEDPNDGPVAREATYIFKPSGRKHDPRIQLIKDVPGTLRIIEVGLEVTV